MTRFVARLFSAVLLVSQFGIANAQKSNDLVALLPKSDSQPSSQSLQRVPRAAILEISKTIDQLVNAQLKENGVAKNPKSPDQVFLRRAYLQIAGRIPTMEEARGFLDDRNKEKRANLIDELLESDAYASHQFNFWADLCLLYTSPSPRDATLSRMPSSA